MLSAASHSAQPPESRRYVPARQNEHCDAPASDVVPEGVKGSAGGAPMGAEAWPPNEGVNMFQRESIAALASASDTKPPGAPRAGWNIDQLASMAAFAASCSDEVAGAANAATGAETMGAAAQAGFYWGTLRANFQAEFGPSVCYRVGPMFSKKKH